MPASYIGSTADTDTNPLSGDWTLPGGWADGDKAIFWWYAPQTGGVKDVTAGAGVTEKVNETGTNGTLFVGWRDLEAGDSTFGWTATSLGSADTIWGVDVFRGLTAGDPFVGALAVTHVNPQNDPDPPAVTPLVGSSVVWTIFGKNDNLDTWPPTPPSGYTLAGGLSTFLGFDASAATAYKIMSGGAGVTENPGAWDVDVSPGSGNAMLTLAAAPETEAIIGSAVFGVATTVNATRAIAFGLDNATNVHSEVGKFKVFGDFEVTGTSTIPGAAVLPIDLTSDVTGDLPFANLTPASAASKLLGRGDSGAGDYQEITLGSGLSMTGTTLAATGGGGGGGSSVGTYASLPAAGTAGTLYFATDSFYHAIRDNGATWDHFRDGQLLTLPVDGDFAWVNQGAASIVTTNGGITLLAPAVSGDNFRIRVKAAPATPYTITAMLLGFGAPTAASYGLCFRQSSDGKLHFLMLGGNVSSPSGGVFSNKFTNPTTFSANYSSTAAQALPMGFPPRFVRIADDGSNRIVSFSSDGINFQVYHSPVRTDFLTADQVGFFVNASSATVAAGVTVLSWKEA